MRTKKLLLILLGALLLLACSSTISWGTYSAGNKTVNSGETFSITVTSSTALEAYNLDLSSYQGLTFKSCSKSEEGAIIDVTGSSIGYMNSSGSTTTLGTYTFQAPTVTKDSTYTIKFMIDQSTPVTSTITVKAPVAEKPNNPTPTTPTTPSTPSTPTTPTTPTTPATKSNNANLSNLGIRPNDFTGFRASTTSYTVNVPNDVTTIEVYANKGHDKQTITGTGKKSLDEGSNRFQVTVTAEDGTKKTYTINVVRLAKEETNNPDVEQAPEVKVALTSLSIEGVTINEVFNPETTEYTATAGSDIEKLNVNAVANVLDAKIEISGADELVEGENIVTITVTDPNGDGEKVYTIKVTKEAVNDEEEEENIIPTVAGSIEENHPSGGDGVPMETLLFCVGIGVVTILGIIFAIIRYRKDQEVEEEVSDIGFVGDISTTEAIKDAAVATTKLAGANTELAEEEAPVKQRGRHF